MALPQSAARLNHIGIAVDNIPQLKKLFGFLGLASVHTEAVVEQGVVTHFIPIPALSSNTTAVGTQLELLEVTDPQGTVAKFIEKRGPGIHHLSFEVETGRLDALCSELRANGYRLIYDAVKKGAHGMRVNFIHPASAGGMLIEVMEKEG